MGYFPGYDMEPCWYCGRSDCNGDHREPEARAASGRIVWQGDRHDRQRCPCKNCQSYRQQVANRDQDEHLR